MGSHSRRESMASASDATTASTSDAPHDLDLDPDFPFPSLDAPLDRRHLRLAAYDLFFAACRSGAASRRTQDNNSNTLATPALPAGAPKPLFAPSRIKTALGLKTRGRPAQLRKVTSSSASSTGSASVRHKRPRTSAELMRQQMSVPAKNDGRLRLAFTRILLEQRGRRAETIVFPLELLRHLRPSDFTDGDEYHLWQRRQLKMLEAGLLLHPAVPLDKAAGPSAARLREIVHAGEQRPIDAGKNSDVIRSLSNCVAALAWRAPDGATADVCHWADGFPLNLHLYLVLLQSIFDKKNDAKVLEEVDELVELIKKTWPTLGIDKDIHNLCFAWVLFQQFVRTGQADEELLSASLTMLAEVSDDAKRADKDQVYAGILSATLTSMQTWAEKKLLDYHECSQIFFSHARHRHCCRRATFIACCHRTDDPAVRPTLPKPAPAGKRPAWKKMCVASMSAWWSLAYIGEFMMRSACLKDEHTCISGGAGMELWPRKVATTKFDLEDMKLVKNAVNGLKCVSTSDRSTSKAAKPVR